MSTAMTEPLSSVPQHAENAELQSNEPVGVQLDNGVRVVAVARKHPLVSLGVYVEAGSRFESHATAGSAFFLSQLYTKSTQTRSSLRLTRELEALAPNLNVKANRETISYRATVPRTVAPALIATLGDMLLPALRHWEVNDARDYVNRQASIARGDDANAAMALMHATAYNHRSLGRPLVLSRGAGDVELSALQSHVEQCFVGNRVVVVVNGLDRDEAAKAVQIATKSLRTASTPAPAASAYVGGQARRELIGGSTNIVIAHSVAKVPVAVRLVLLALLGRDDGPDAYRLVGGAARLGKIDSEVHVSNGFLCCSRSANSALLGIKAVSMEGKAPQALSAIRAVLASLARIDNDQLRGAQRRVIRELYSAFNGAEVVPILASHALSGFPLLSAKQLADQINKLTVTDVGAAVQALLATPETCAAVGDVEAL